MKPAMISSSAALAQVLDTVPSVVIDHVPLEQVVGRTLATKVRADRDFPPFDRVTMDGIAIAAAAHLPAHHIYAVAGVAAAGQPRAALSDHTKCIEVMTGAPLPQGCDTVVRYEDLTKHGEAFRLDVLVEQGKNVHRQGTDHPAGKVLLSEGHIIKAIDINVLATVGLSVVPVRSLPSVAVISSGDELVGITESPLPHQIRTSNSHMLHARLRQLDISASLHHVADDKEQMIAATTQIASSHDVLLISGGVSKGKFDFMPSVLEEVGFIAHFHRVAQRPGKPFWFGTKGEQVVFAFPGNPVSTLACFHKYFVPWLQRRQGRGSTMLRVSLAEDVVFKPDLTYFAQASISQSADGVMQANVAHGRGSGDMVSPTSQDGFVELPAGQEIFRKGEVFNFMPFQPLYR